MIKRSGEKLDYGINWADWLDAENDTISTATWIVPDGLVGAGETIRDGVTKGGAPVPKSLPVIFLSGGVDGRDYQVVCRVATEGGRIDEGTLSISVRDRR